MFTKNTLVINIVFVDIIVHKLDQYDEIFIVNKQSYF